MKNRKTEAMKIIEARRGSYATSLPGGYMDETELLLMSQHYGELQSRAKKKGKVRRRTRHEKA